ncbi:MAG: MATE family efflux transporter [Bacteroidota bacterium]
MQNLFAGGLARSISLAVLQGLEPLAYLGLLAMVSFWSGPSEAGLYVYFIDSVAIFTILAVFGFDVSGVRFLAAAVATGDLPRAHAFARFAQRVVVAAGFASALAALVVWQLIGDQATRLPAATLLGAATIPLHAVTLTQLALLRGMGECLIPRLLKAGIPAATLLICGVVRQLGLLTEPSVVALLAIQAIVLGIALTVAIYRLSQFRLSSCADRSSFAPYTWLGTSATLLLVSAVMVIQSRLDTVMLATLRSETEAAVYALVSKCSLLLILPLTTVNYVIAPRCASLHAAGDQEGMRRLVLRAAQLSLGLALPIGAILSLVGQPMLNLLGEEFASRPSLLLLAMTAPLVQAATGSVAVVASMTGNQVVVGVVQTTAVLTNIALNAVAIPVFGVWGAVATTATITIAARLAMVYGVWLRAGILTLPIPLGHAASRETDPRATGYRAPSVKPLCAVPSSDQ